MISYPLTNIFPKKKSVFYSIDSVHHFTKLFLLVQIKAFFVWTLDDPTEKALTLLLKIFILV